MGTGKQTHAPYFRVSHKPITQSDRKTVGVESAVAMIPSYRVHVSRVSSLDCVAFHALLRCDAPAIVHADPP